MKIAWLTKTLALSILISNAPCFAEEARGGKPAPFRYRNPEGEQRPHIDRLLYLQKRLQQFKEGPDKNISQYLHIKCALTELELSKGMRSEALNHIKEVLSDYKEITSPYKEDLNRRLWQLLEKRVRSPDFDQQDVNWIMSFTKLYGSSKPYTDGLSFEKQSLVDKFVDRQRAGECERALDEMQAVRERAFGNLDPALLEILEMKLRLFRRTNDSAKYEKVAEKMLYIMERNPTGNDISIMESIIVKYIRFGLVAKAKALTAQAEELYRSGLSTNLKHVRFLNSIASTYLSNRQFKDAEAILRLALACPYSADPRKGNPDAEDTLIDEESERVALRCNVNDLISAYISNSDWIAAEHFSEFAVEQEEQISGESSILTNHARISLAALYSAHSFAQRKILTSVQTSERMTKSKLLFEKALDSLKKAPNPDADEISAALRKREIVEHYPALARFVISRSIRYTDLGIKKYSILGMIFGDQEIDIHAAGEITVKSQPHGTLLLTVDKRTLPERAQELLDQGKVQRAMDVLESACMANLDSSTFTLLGECLSLTGDNESAIQACNYAETLTPKSAYAYSVRSLSHSNQNSEAEAIADAKTALQLISPGGTKDAGLSKARCLLATGQYSNAVDMLSSILSNQPKSWRARYYRAMAFRKLGKIFPAQADEKLKDEIAKTPEKIEGSIGSDITIDGSGYQSKSMRTGIMIGDFQDLHGTRIGGSDDDPVHMGDTTLRQRTK